MFLHMWARSLRPLTLEVLDVDAHLSFPSFTGHMQRPWRHVPGEPATPGGPHTDLHPAAEPGRPVRRGDLQQGAAALLQCHRCLRGLAGPTVAAAGADVARCPHHCLWVEQWSRLNHVGAFVFGRPSEEKPSVRLTTRLQRPLPVGVQRERHRRVWCQQHGMDPDYPSEEGGWRHSSPSGSSCWSHQSPDFLSASLLSSGSTAECRWLSEPTGPGDGAAHLL